MKITKDKWIWMPHPAHFICSRDCRFFLATKVGKFIVSTVGEYFPDRAVREIHAQVYDAEWLAKNKILKGDHFDAEYMKKFGYEEIGYGRKYETMVFKAMPRKHKNRCCPYMIISGDNVDFEGYNSAEEAYKGHLKLCNKYANK